MLIRIGRLPCVAEVVARVDSLIGCVGKIGQNFHFGFLESGEVLTEKNSASCRRCDREGLILRGGIDGFVESATWWTVLDGVGTGPWQTGGASASSWG